MTQQQVAGEAVGLTDQDIAYKLVIELLAYQFASPVQWIDTQDVLINEFDCRNFVEFGPNDVLNNMLKTTLASLGRREAIRGNERRIFSHESHAKDLYRGFTTDADVLIEESSSGNEPTESTLPNVLAVDRKPEALAADVKDIRDAALAATNEAVSRIVRDVYDPPLIAKEVLFALVAIRLRSSLALLDTTKSIKQLVAGRSILQNEIIGDIEAEFESAPEQAETTSLDDLANILQASPFSGHLGEVSKLLVVKVCSSKMPGGYTEARVRRYLSESCGLKAGRQNAVLLHGAVGQPGNRIQAEQSADDFWRAQAEAVMGALVSHEIMPPQSSTIKEYQGSAEEAAALQKTRTSAERTELMFKARLLGYDLDAEDKVKHEAEEELRALQQRLADLTKELGDEFVDGIRPLWSKAKARVFESSWNWAMEDLISHFHALKSGRVSLTASSTDESLQSVTNRKFPRLLEVARYLQNEYSGTVGCPLTDFALEYLRTFIAAYETAQPFPTLNKVAYHALHCSKAPQTTTDEKGNITYSEVARNSDAALAEITLEARGPHKHLDPVDIGTSYSTLIKELQEGTSNVTMAGRNVLVTGAGRNSIGAELVKTLISAGARVIVTSSSYSLEQIRWFRNIFHQHGASGSRLIVVPFNQACQADIAALIKWIYNPTDGLGIDLDHVVPFAAVSEVGRQLDNIDAKSELAHRIMLTNLYRLLGHIVQQKKLHGIRNRITQVVMPFSPNHGIFGGDGLYAESKVGLEVLLTKWHSERWSEQLSICGASIGWTRGTGLMQSNDMVAEGIEALGVRTFTTPEMAFYLSTLMVSTIAETNELVPLFADLTGGMGQCLDLAKTVSALRRSIRGEAKIRQAIWADSLLDGLVEPEQVRPDRRQQAHLRLEFPPLPQYEDQLAPLAEKLEGMHDLDKIVVIVGFGEVGPHGSSRTRWEMEKDGQWSLEGVVEMAWMTGKIKFQDADVGGKRYVGWIDVGSNTPISDEEIVDRYKNELLKHAGIRPVETASDVGYGSNMTMRRTLQELVLTADMPVMHVSTAVATAIKNEQGDFVDVYQTSGDDNKDEQRVIIRKGATIVLPKAVRVPHSVAGQLPTGWDARNYGIPEDIADQVDRVTLFSLVATSEAFLLAGIVDVYELYKYIHVSELGNCVGSGLGGLRALKDVLRHRQLGQVSQADVLQETFINTTAAWINMLLVSAAGPLRTPVGACATALESLESGCELISTGKAKICLVGGVDDLDESISIEFANMGATANPADEMAAGRLPQESSRPGTSSRCGFVESHGAGVQILTTARLALDMGLPIHAIIAFAGTSSDKVGRSVPAPGQGILSNAREMPRPYQHPMLDISYRARQLKLRQEQINEYRDSALQHLSEGSMQDEHRRWIISDTEQQHKAALDMYGHSFWVGNEEIAPLRGALATWGLTIDDLDFASLHGTSTVQNDLNETAVLQRQLEHLGRSRGNVVMCTFQKYLTGHSKGAAAAWMLNGCMQTLQSGCIPGNRNADDVESKLETRDLLFYPSQSIATSGVKAFSITSFGFGQKGAQAIGIHPRYLFASIGRTQYETYCKRVVSRTRKASQAFSRAVALNSICDIKSTTPWDSRKEIEVLLDSTYRLGLEV